MKSLFSFNKHNGRTFIELLKCHLVCDNHYTTCLVEPVFETTLRKAKKVVSMDILFFFCFFLKSFSGKNQIFASITGGLHSEMVLSTGLTVICWFTWTVSLNFWTTLARLFMLISQMYFIKLYLNVKWRKNISLKQFKISVSAPGHSIIG